MTAQMPLITLPGLQSQLDLLPPGQTLTIAGDTYHRLFGINHAAWNRLAHFAEGHRCRADRYDGSIVFRKRS